MINHANDKAFIFNEAIHTQSINELYGNDYVYVQEVFETVLNEYEMLSNNIDSCYDSHNIPALKAAVHKIKPIFGFVGLVGMQEECQQFENTCQTTASFDHLVYDFTLLKNNLKKSKLLIEEEKRKLEQFNNQRA